MAAGAALNSVPSADYTGLSAGSAYFAYDPVTRTYWAGAAMAPKRTSLRALVSTQDAGGYLLFFRPIGQRWHAADVGTAGIGESDCPVPLPESVRRRWGWAPGAYHPPPAPMARRSP